MRVKKIETEEIAMWVQAVHHYCKVVGRKTKGEDYTRLEHAMITSLAAARLKCQPHEVMSDQLPQIVIVCFQAFRPLSSVLKESEVFAESAS